MIDDDTAPLPTSAATLTEIAERFDALEGVTKAQLAPGDVVLVTTRNSHYTLRALGGHLFAVSGGWFRRFGGGEVVVPVSGCTFGGRAISARHVAAPGVYLEFGNGVRTTRIETVEHRPGAGVSLVN